LSQYFVITLAELLHL